MTLTELRYVVAVAREGHFGKAAKSCFVSQPTLSLGIKKLEENLGVNLFERNHNHIIITPIGKKIIAQAERALSEVKLIHEIAANEKSPLREPVRVGAIYTVGPYLFPSLLPILRDKAPELPLLVEENFTATLSQRLRNGDIDIAILSLPFDEPGIETLPLYDEPFVALIPSSHPLALKEQLDFNDFDNETVLLLGPQHCFRDQVLALCPKCAHSLQHNDNLQSTLSGSSIETIRYMVASGVGITILPCTAACADRYKHGLLKIRRIEGAQKGRTIALAWRKTFDRQITVDVMAESILDCSLSGIKLLNIDSQSKTKPLIQQGLQLPS